MPFANRKIILENFFSLVLSQFKKYHSSGNITFNTSVILQSLKLRILKGKILPISLKLNFTPDTLGGYDFKLENEKTPPQSEYNSTSS